MNLKGYTNYLKSLAKITIRKYLIICFILFVPTSNFAQVDIFKSIFPQSAIGMEQKKFRISMAIVDTNKFVMQKSPWGAVLRSAIIPGYGQFYNESYWKIPVIWSVLGYLSYQWNSANISYRQYRDLYELSITPDKKSNLKYLEWREFYKDQRDFFAVFIGITYFLNLVDAYVDAHLFDFDVSENTDIHSIQLSVRLKL